MTAKPDRSRVGLAPMLSVRRGPEAVAFYKAAFGAREVFKIEDRGAVVAELSVQGAKFWSPTSRRLTRTSVRKPLGGATTRLVLVVDDPEAVHARALAAGARQVWPVREENGWFIGRVVDPFGHHWEIGKPLGPGVGE